MIVPRVSIEKAAFHHPVGETRTDTHISVDPKKSNWKVQTISTEIFIMQKCHRLKKYKIQFALKNLK